MVCRNPLLQPQIRKQSLGPSLVAAHGKSPRRSKTTESQARLAVEIVFQQPAKAFSPDLRKSRKSTPRYLQVSDTLSSVRYSSIPFFVEDPAITSRGFAN